MDDLKKKYEELKNKPENELDAFEQEALEGLEKTDLNRASITKKYYDAQFLNKYSSKKKFNIKILYFSAAALLLLALTVWLWRFYLEHDSVNEFLTINTEAKNEISTHPFTPSSVEKSTKEENTTSLNKNPETPNKELNSSFIEKSDLKDIPKNSFPKDVQPKYKSDDSEAPLPSEQKEPTGNGISPAPGFKDNTEEQKISTRETMAASSAPETEYYAPKKSIDRGKIEKNNIKIKGDFNLFNDKENLKSDLNQLAEKYHLELIEIEIKDKKEVINILVSGLTNNNQPNSFNQEFEEIIKRNLLKEHLNKKIEIKNKPD
jgi:cytoskeletal protein RodZ